MRRICLTVLLASIAAAGPATAQKPPEASPDKLPAKGDEVMVRGCVQGTTLESYETRRVDDSGKLTTAITYRLTGPKATLRALRDEHNGRAVDIEGILKSDLPGDRGATRGKQIGKSRVFIGIGAPPRGNSPADAVPYLPVLEVVSFEPVGGRCSR